jgi:2-hydroxy-6-oxonona-2,4-dienedioate hydrolase
MKFRYLDIDGTPSRVIEAGAGDAPPLLMVHGIALTAEVWLRNIDALARDRRVVSLDLLGHGFTQPPAGVEADVPAKLRHLLRIADHLGFERFALCGSSYGALLCMNVFLTAPDRVTHLVINGSGSSFNSDAQFAAQIANPAAVFNADVTSLTPAMWRQRLAFNFYDAALIPPELPMIAAHSYAQPWARAAWDSTIGEMRDAERFGRHRVLHRLEEITAPSLVFWGAQDPGGTLESATAAVARMPAARLVSYDRCGHYPMIEHAEDWNREVRAFLAG